MASVGYINVHAYTSYAQIPLQDVAVEITAKDGTMLALRLTDKNGRITPVALPVPDRAESQKPNPDEIPYALVNLYAYKENYEVIEVEDLQVFAATTTTQDLEMIPSAQFPDSEEGNMEIDTPPQDL